MLEYLAAHFAGCLAADAVRFKQEERAAAKVRAELEGKWDFATSEMIVDPVDAGGIAEIRGLVQSMASACSILDDMDFCEGVGLSGMTFRDIFLDDAAKFMLCAAMVDGALTATRLRQSASSWAVPGISPIGPGKRPPSGRSAAPIISRSRSSSRYHARWAIS